MTTAALDCQSKPNQITITGAMPIIGSPETMFCRSAAGPGQKKRNRSAKDGYQNRSGQPDHISRKAPP